MEVAVAVVAVVITVGAFSACTAQRMWGRSRGGWGGLGREGHGWKAG